MTQQHVPYPEFQAYVLALGLKKREEFVAWAATDARPAEIPAEPQIVYRGKGWHGWGSLFGKTPPSKRLRAFNSYLDRRWDRNAVRAFLKGLVPQIATLSESELYMIVARSDMPERVCGGVTTSLVGRMRQLAGVVAAGNAVDYGALLDEIEAGGAFGDAAGTGTPATAAAAAAESEEAAEAAARAAEELRTLNPLAELQAVDALAAAGTITDTEVLEFLVQNRVARLWQLAIDGAVPKLATLRDAEAGPYFNAIRSRFLAEHDAVLALPIPLGYAFRRNGKKVKPNLMQRLTAYRVERDGRVGNWSGPGAGKTLAAVLASRVVGARLTVAVVHNSTVETWAETVRAAFPATRVVVKDRGPIELDPARPNCLIFNYESFQQPDSAAMVEQLAAGHVIDFLVFDEVQKSKQRRDEEVSRRRAVLLGLLKKASRRNPQLRVLGMSATPVLNNLFEPRALLQMITGRSLAHVATRPTVANAIRMHAQLTLHGIRYRPKYAQPVQQDRPQVDGNALLPALYAASRGGPLAIEQVLLDAKLPAILKAVRPGTLVYTHYVDGMIDPLVRAIRGKGLTVGVYSGEDKGGLDDFLAGRCAVLVGSAPVATGVDRLQDVCDRIVIASLPWTGAEYEQLVGRIHRQGSRFASVTVVIPRVVLNHGGETWSWDRDRLDRVRFKRTLGDAALDGVVPPGELIDPDEMRRRAAAVLRSWLAAEQDAA